MDRVFQVNTVTAVTNVTTVTAVTTVTTVTTVTQVGMQVGRFQEGFSYKSLLTPKDHEFFLDEKQVSKCF